MKLSTGYLTPQGSRNKKASDNRRSVNTLAPLPEINDSMFEKLMSCPIKRQLVLKLIDSEKDKIEAYKKKIKNNQKRDMSPLNKLSKNRPCESPTELRRRRALEQLNRRSPLVGTSSESFSRCNSVNSDASENSSSSNTPPIPFEKLLEGVVAFVEVKSKGQDRSVGVKALMASMGAQIKDNFSKDVTHVVFKDGSYTTFQKAKLMNIHLVSVLWIEAVRSNGARVPEKKFPALGTDAYDHNISKICSQMQKDYEDIIKDELQRSLATGISLPTTKALIERRRTIMSPKVSSSYRTFSQDFSSQDREVDQIISQARIKSRMTMDFLETMEGGDPELTSDDDDSGCGPIVNGDIITKKDILVLPLNNVTNMNVSEMDLTSTGGSKPSITPKMRRSLFNVDENYSGIFGDESVTGKNTSRSIYNAKTPKIIPNPNGIIDGNMNETFETPNLSLYKRRTKSICMPPEMTSEDKTPNNTKNQSNIQILSKNRSNMSPVVHQNIVVKEASNPVQKSNNSNLKMAGLKLFSESKIGESNEDDKVISSDMSSLKISVETSPNVKLPSLSTSSENDSNQKTTSTNMSSLRLSSNKPSEKTTSTNMSMLQLSSEIKIISETVSKPTEGDRKSATSAETNELLEENYSFSPLQQNTFNNILNALDTPPLAAQDNITKRRKRKSVESPLAKTSGDSGVVDANNAIGKTDVNDSKSPTQVGKTIDDSPSKKSKTTKTPKTNSAKNNYPNKPKPNTRAAATGKTRLTPNLEKKTTTFKRRSNSLGARCATCEISPNKKSKVQSTDDQLKETKLNKRHSPKKHPSTQKTRRIRKLYDPEDAADTIITSKKLSDDEERSRKRQQALKKPGTEGEIAITAAILQVHLKPLSEEKDRLGNDTSSDDNLLNKSDDSEIKVPVKKTRKKKIDETPLNLTVNGDRDEQCELKKEMFGKTNEDGTNDPQSKKENCSVSRNISDNESPKKIPNPTKGISKSTGKLIKRRKSLRLIGNKTKICQDKDLMTPVRDRRSTMEFQSTAEMSAKRKLKIDKLKQPSIVCTKLHKDDIMVFNQIVKKLGNFVIEDEVSSKTTHLVAGEPKRTINMLRAMATGCWILKHEWVLKSLEMGKWLPEENFEETDFSPAVQQSRLHRQAFGPTYSMDIFKECGRIYVAKGSIPRCSDLRELITMCQGNVTTILRNANILVGGYVSQRDVICVKETWVLDSITNYKKMPFKNYLIKADNGVII